MRTVVCIKYLGMQTLIFGRLITCIHALVFQDCSSIKVKQNFEILFQLNNNK